MAHHPHHSKKIRHLKLDIVVFLNVLLASIVIGGLAHEVIHVIFIPYAVKLTIDFSNPAELLYVCCFQPGEEPLFEVFLSLFVQFVVMVTWIYINRDKFLKETKEKE